MSSRRRVSSSSKRSLAIAKELAVLTTNLPVAWDSSIFLRVDETRVDVIKALITGPEGRPYVHLEPILRCNLTLHSSFWKIPQWLVCGIHLAHSLRRVLTVPLLS